MKTVKKPFVRLKARWQGSPPSPSTPSGVQSPQQASVGTSIPAPSTSQTPIATPSAPNGPAPASTTSAPTTTTSAASNTSRTDLWQAALHKLDDEGQAWIKSQALQALSDRERVTDIIDRLKEKRQQCEEAGWDKIKVFGRVVSLRDITSSTIAWLHKFKEIGDLAVQYDPAHAALPWAAARFVLMCVVSNHEHMGVLMTVLEKTARIVHRCEVYEMLYLNNDMKAELAGGLQVTLEKLYAQVLDVLINTSKFLNKGTPGRIFYDVFHPNEGSSLLTGINAAEEEVAVQGDVCEKHRSQRSDANMTISMQRLLKLETPINRTDQNVEKVLQALENQELTDILTWISGVQYGLHHDDVRERRTKDTGEWILEQPRFHEWHYQDGSVMLWLQGSAGTGKTFLTSRVIDAIEARLEQGANDEGFAFFYCNHNEQERREALTVLRSYVRQLSSSQSLLQRIHPEIRKLFNQSNQSGTGWTLKLCKDKLIELFDFYPRTTLVLDALDECTIEDRAILLNFFNSLAECTRNPVKIFVSSRPEGDIRSRLNSLPNIELSALYNRVDIVKFISDCLDDSYPWSSVLAQRPELKRNVIIELEKKSEGMFQWVSLQINQLRRLDHEKDILERLAKLPGGLEKAYEEIYGRILDRPAHSRTQALRALEWVICAKKPLSDQQLREAVCVDIDNDSVNFQDAPTQDDVLGWCANLLYLDKQQDPPLWRPSHFSVVEYLESTWPMPNVHCSITVANLTLLLEVEHTHRRNDIREYALYNWLQHVKAHEGAEFEIEQPLHKSLSQKLKRFIGSPQEFGDSWEQPRFNYGDEYQTPLFFACYHGLFYVLRDWWAQEGKISSFLSGDIDVPKPGWKGPSALILAVLGGSKEICSLLIDQGADVNFRSLGLWIGWDAPKVVSSPLAAAAAINQCELIELLLQNGADVDMLLDYGDGSALAVTSRFRSADAAQVLINHGAKVDLLLDRGGTALAIAAHEGNLDQIQLLLDNGADPNLAVPRYGTALIVCASAGHISFLGSEGNVDAAIRCIRCLTAGGADVNQCATTGDYGSALEAAAHEGSLKIVQTLLEEGANVNLCGTVGLYGTALTAAVTSHHFDIVKLLIEKGANINAAAGRYGSALAAACSGIHWSEETNVIDLLLENDADVNQPLQTGYFGTALIAAAYYGNIKYIQRLLAKRADVNASPEIGWYGSALVAALCGEYSDDKRAMSVLQVLLDNDAEVNQDLRAGDYGTALIAAACHGRLGCVELLIQRGAHVNAAPAVGLYGSALAAAAFFGRDLIVARLLQSGARVDFAARHPRYRTASEAARTELLDEDIRNQRFLFGDTPWAEFMSQMREGKRRVETLLLDEGVAE